MATKVLTQYGKGQEAVSITTRNGRVTKVTTWKPGRPGSTDRLGGWVRKPHE